MKINSEELFAQIGHLTVEAKVLYAHIANLEARIKELEGTDKDSEDPAPEPDPAE